MSEKDLQCVKENAAKRMHELKKKRSLLSRQSSMFSDTGGINRQLSRQFTEKNNGFEETKNLSNDEDETTPLPFERLHK